MSLFQQICIAAYHVSENDLLLHHLVAYESSNYKHFLRIPEELNLSFYSNSKTRYLVKWDSGCKKYTIYPTTYLSLFTQYKLGSAVTLLLKQSSEGRGAFAIKTLCPSTSKSSLAHLY